MKSDRPSHFRDPAGTAAGGMHLPSVVGEGDDCLGHNNPGTGQQEQMQCLAVAPTPSSKGRGVGGGEELT